VRRQSLEAVAAQPAGSGRGANCLPEVVPGAVGVAVLVVKCQELLYPGPHPRYMRLRTAIVTPKGGTCNVPLIRGVIIPQ